MRELDVYSLSSALDPLSMRGHAQEYRIMVVQLGKSRLDHAGNMAFMAHFGLLWRITIATTEIGVPTRRKFNRVSTRPILYERACLRA